MYKPDKKTKVNFFAFFILSSIIAYLLYYRLKPYFIEEACVSYAQKTVEAATVNSLESTCNCSFDEIKNECINTSTNPL
jgi:hypothetical protein